MTWMELEQGDRVNIILDTDQVIPQTFYLPGHIAMDFFSFKKKIVIKNCCLDSFWSRSKNNFVLFSHVLIFVFLTQSKNSTTVFEVFEFLGLRNHWQKIDYFWPLCNV